ncbi:hypothetical protein [Trichocoleus sp. FACHB-262]|uniref:hypothetical protein n=1 Tax=Trichocoleus sp. FACHB-262 TaxID=2692869 RepID=UPI0016877BC6|nr:hypothetical protein [Trichocoleus sp. FACHB-262]MBD2124250.1 hypothetical protein [Trichocoleus sp. FACHB-262]
MRPQRIALLVSLLASLPVGLVLPLSITSNPTPVTQAQTLESRITEAGRWLEQGGSNTEGVNIRKQSNLGSKH